MKEAVTLERPGRRVVSYSSGKHLPSPYKAADGWRCHDCGAKLYRYFFATRQEWRLRHDWRAT